MLNILKTTRAKIAYGLVATVALIAAWFYYDLPVAILAPLIYVQWLPLITSRSKQEPVASSNVTLMLLLVGVLVLLVGLTLYFAIR